jgi:hypothetical protein
MRQFPYQISYPAGAKGGGMTDDSTPRITALTPAQAARILAAAGKRRITEAMVKADGTLNLVHYTAWLAREAAHGD